MIEYIGNSSEVINWDEVIAGLEKHEYESHPGKFQVPEHNLKLHEVIDPWIAAGYKPVEEGGSVQWDMFHPGVHFDQSVVDQFVSYFNITTYNTAWISRVKPGHVSPIHWDMNPDEDKILLRERWHAHIGKPAFGHVFVVEDTCLHSQPQGATYKWSDRRFWHAGSNIGLVHKYQFNLW